jgi:DNA-binding transcriptional ArsR family regulator
VVARALGVAKERFLIDAAQASTLAKRVLVSDRPDDFRPAFSRVGQRILSLLAAGPKYPAEIARALGTTHQSVYYNVRHLEEAGLITKVRSQMVRGGEANLFSLSSDGYAVEYAVKGEQIPSIPSASRSKILGRFFKEFVRESELDGWIVVGSPIAHGSNNTQARDGHYGIQLGFALGQFVRLPERFPVKLDVDIKAEKLERSNLVVVGGPRTNVLAEELNEHLPIRFKQGGFWGSIVDDHGRSYNSELDSVVAKVKNPWDDAKTCIMAAGLTGSGTKGAVIGITNLAEEVLQGYKSGDFACVLRGVDRDGDGKVDGAELLRRL